MRSYGLFYLASLCTVAQIATAFFFEVPVLPASAALALLTGLCGAFFIYWSLIALYKHGRIPRGAAYPRPTIMVDRGPYTIIRHPQYLGYMLINATFILSNPCWPGILLGAAAIVGYFLYARQEDRRLQAAYGPDYMAYAALVPGFNVVSGLLRLARG